MPGVCTACGAADVDVNESGMCPGCAGGGEAAPAAEAPAEAPAEGGDMGGGDAAPEAPAAE